MILPNFDLAQYGMNGTQIVTSSDQDLLFDTTIKPSTGALSFNNTTGIITANRDVKLKISYNVFMILDSGDSQRNTMVCRLQINGVDVSYSKSASYARGYNYSRNANCSIPPTYIELDDGDELKVVVIRDDDIQSPSVGNGETWILLEEILN